MGAEGVTIDHADQVGDALRAAVRSDKPAVLNLRLTQELADPFRRDAFKQPKRLLQKYKPLSAVMG
jgi:sulfoacetaldehyde acetyltransferase